MIVNILIKAKDISKTSPFSPNFIRPTKCHQELIATKNDCFFFSTETNKPADELPEDPNNVLQNYDPANEFPEDQHTVLQNNKSERREIFDFMGDVVVRALYQLSYEPDYFNGLLNYMNYMNDRESVKTEREILDVTGILLSKLELLRSWTTCKQSAPSSIMRQTV